MCINTVYHNSDDNTVYQYSVSQYCVSVKCIIVQCMIIHCVNTVYHGMLKLDN